MPASDSIKSVVRTFALLDALAAAPDGMSAAHLAEQLSVKPTTMHNFVRTLLAEGVLQRVGSSTRYTLGPRLWSVLGQAGRRLDAAHAEKAVRRLADALPKATVVFARHLGGETVVELRMSPDQPGHLHRPTGQTLSPYTSACGLGMQAFGSEEEIAEMHRRFPFEEYGGHAWAGPDALEEFLAECRRRGVVEAPTKDGSLLRLAMPWRARDGRFAAIGVSAPASTETSTEHMLNEMKRWLPAGEPPESNQRH